MFRAAAARRGSSAPTKKPSQPALLEASTSASDPSKPKDEQPPSNQSPQNKQPPSSHPPKPSQPPSSRPPEPKQPPSSRPPEPKQPPSSRPPELKQPPSSRPPLTKVSDPPRLVRAASEPKIGAAAGSSKRTKQPIQPKQPRQTQPTQPAKTAELVQATRPKSTPPKQQLATRPTRRAQSARVRSPSPRPRDTGVNTSPKRQRSATTTHPSVLRRVNDSGGAGVEVSKTYAEESRAIENKQAARVPVVGSSPKAKAKCHQSKESAMPSDVAPAL